MALKQPICQVRLTNVAVVRLKTHGRRFEIACYKNKVLDWRSGKESDIDEVLQSGLIFTNVSKGDVAKKNEIVKAFGTDDVQAVCKTILDKGEMQVSEKERESELESLWKDLINLIREFSVNPQTGLTLSHSLIRSALKEVGFSVKLGESAKKQALRAIDVLCKKMPQEVMRCNMRMIIYTCLANKPTVRDFIVNKCNAYIEYEHTNYNSIKKEPVYNNNNNNCIDNNSSNVNGEISRSKNNEIYRGEEVNRHSNDCTDKFSSKCNNNIVEKEKGRTGLSNVNEKQEEKDESNMCGVSERSNNYSNNIESYNIVNSDDGNNNNNNNLKKKKKINKRTGKPQMSNHKGVCNVNINSDALKNDVYNNSTAISSDSTNENNIISDSYINSINNNNNNNNHMNNNNVISKPRRGNKKTKIKQHNKDKYNRNTDSDNDFNIHSLMQQEKEKKKKEKEKEEEEEEDDGLDYRSKFAHMNIEDDEEEEEEEENDEKEEEKKHSNKDNRKGAISSNNNRNFSPFYSFSSSSSSSSSSDNHNNNNIANINGVTAVSADNSNLASNNIYTNNNNGDEGKHDIHSSLHPTYNTNTNSSHPDSDVARSNINCTTNNNNNNNNVTCNNNNNNNSKDTSNNNNKDARAISAGNDDINNNNKNECTGVEDAEYSVTFLVAPRYYRTIDEFVTSSPSLGGTTKMRLIASNVKHTPHHTTHTGQIDSSSSSAASRNTTEEKQEEKEKEKVEEEEEKEGEKGGIKCSTCKLRLEDASSYRMHCHSEMHAYNVKRKIKCLRPVNAEEFEQISIDILHHMRAVD